jgi:hypothetical protein
LLICSDYRAADSSTVFHFLTFSLLLLSSGVVGIGQDVSILDIFQLNSIILSTSSRFVSFLVQITGRLAQEREYTRLIDTANAPIFVSWLRLFEIDHLPHSVD